MREFLERLFLPIRTAPAIGCPTNIGNFSLHSLTCELYNPAEWRGRKEFYSGVRPIAWTNSSYACE